MIGRTVSHYKILEKLGEGGMGVVYSARDVKLDRLVALKFLPPDLTRDAEAKERFIHEAKASSALDHPNICTIYEVGETDDGQMFIAMSCCEGETLKQRIAQGPLKIDDAIDVVIQVAHGLQKAHDRGIVHRDIKPANIFITNDKIIKILDFGLAKLSGITKLTRAGSTLGTPSYISPEQARGEEVDPRTDIWSLGVVLYESITGQLPFKGGYDNAIIYTIQHTDPDPVTALRTGVPMELERIIDKCLEKEAGHRYQDVIELIVDLQRLKRGTDSSHRRIQSISRGSLNSAKRALSKSKWMLIAIGATIVAVEAFHYLAAVRSVSSSKTAAAGLQASGNHAVVQQLTASTGVADYPTVSPDGEWVAYSSDDRGNLDIWKKRIRGGEAIQLTNSSANENHPAWSPDGKTIAYSSDQDNGGIFLVPAEGGQTMRRTQIGSNPSWSPDSKRIAFNWNGHILVVLKDAGTPRQVVSWTSAARHIAWSPDGTKIAFWHRTKGDIYVYSFKDSTQYPLNLINSGGVEISGLAWARKGLLVYSVGPFGGDKQLMKVPVDSAGVMRTGEPEPLLGHFGSTTDDSHCSFSADGSKLVFAARQVERQIWSLRLDPLTGLASGQGKQITSSSRLNEYPAVSPDGRLLVWTSHEPGSGHIYLKNLMTGTESKLTTDWKSLTREAGASFAPKENIVTFSSTSAEGFEIYKIAGPGAVDQKVTETKLQDVHPRWSPGGDAVIFYSNRAGNWDIWSVALTGGGELRQLTDSKSNEMYPSWSPDGRLISFTSDSKEGGGSTAIWLMAADGSNQRPFVASRGEEGWSCWSPNGNYLYFSSNRSGFFNIWIKSLKDLGERQITHYSGSRSGLPEQALFTKFAVSSSSLFIPMETRKSNIFMVEGIR